MSRADITSVPAVFAVESMMVANKAGRQVGKTLAALSTIMDDVMKVQVV